MRLQVLLLLTVASYSSPIVRAQELPDQAKAFREDQTDGGIH